MLFWKIKITNIIGLQIPNLLKNCLGSNVQNGYV